MTRKISEIQLIPVSFNSGHLAFAQWIYNDELKFSNVAVYSKRDGSGLRLVYPTMKNNLPTINPISQRLGQFFEKEIENVYRGNFGNYKIMS